MSDLRKAAQQALIVLRCIEYDSCETVVDGPDKYMCDDAYEALRAALAQPEKLVVGGDDLPTLTKWTPAAKSAPLTDEALMALVDATIKDGRCEFARAIEKAHGIGG